MGALDDMALFAAVARHGRIRAAAAGLETQPSTVSRRLTALVKRLGVRLVTRTSRRFILMEAGSTYYEECRRLVEREAGLRGDGLLRLATFFVAAEVEAGRLVPVLTRFWHRITIYAVSAGGRLAPRGCERSSRCSARSSPRDSPGRGCPLFGSRECASTERPWPFLGSPIVLNYG